MTNRKVRDTVFLAVLWLHKTIQYCLANGIMIEYLRNHQKEVIDMFSFEWNEKEEREALLK